MKSLFVVCLLFCGLSMAQQKAPVQTVKDTTVTIDDYLYMLQGEYEGNEQAINYLQKQIEQKKQRNIYLKGKYDATAEIKRQGVKEVQVQVQVQDQDQKKNLSKNKKE